MKKSVYSLVLMDNVIKAVDRRASQLGTSRSNLINQILAEHLSCITPEVRMRDIFNSIIGMIQEEFRIPPQNSNSNLILQTDLEYKYRPTVNYKVEINRSPDCYIGKLKVQFRTVRLELVNLLLDFFSKWIDMESELLHQYGGVYSTADYVALLNARGYERNLFFSQNRSDKEIGEDIYSYICLLDQSLKLYFSSPQEFPAFIPKIAEKYKLIIKNGLI